MRIPRLLIATLALIGLVSTACSGAGGTESVADTLPPDATDTGTTPVPSEGTGDDAETVAEPVEEEPPSAGALTGGTLRIGLPALGPVDPARASLGSQSEMIVADLLFDGLTDWDAERGVLVAGVALRWEPDDDATTWTFTLDPDATFSDGQPLTAGDVKASLERLVAADPVAVGATRLEVVGGFDEFVDGDADGIAGLVVDGTRKLVVELTEPMAALPWILSSPVYGVVGPDGPDGAGSGPFRITAESDGAMRLEPSDGTTSLVDAVELVELDTADAVSAVRDGEGALDVVVLGHDAARELDARGSSALTLVTTPFQVHVYLGLGGDSGAFDDADLRRAVVASVDTAVLTGEVFGPTAQAIAGLIPGSDVCNGLCGGDAEVVAGYLDDLDGEVGELTVDYIDDDDRPDDPAIARLVADQLVEAGSPVRLRSWDADDYVEALAAGELEIFWFGWVGVGQTPESWVGHYASGHLDNIVGVELDVVDAALGVARGAASRADAAEAYAVAEEAVVATGRVLPVAEFVTLVAVDDHVEGLTVRPDGTFDVTSMWLARPDEE